MPNNGRYTLCPYFRSEKKNSISCEDTFRTFGSVEKKQSYMDRYCDRDWTECPYAKEMSKVYDGEEEGMTERILEHKCAATTKELKKAASVIGKSKNELAAKDKKIKELTKKVTALENMYIRQAGKVAEYREMEKKFAGELQTLMRIYETRFAYLIWRSGGCLNDSEVEEFARTHEFRLYADEEKAEHKNWIVDAKKREPKKDAE